ncbi:MAG TPA: PIN domain-containing protein [Polyangiaceae bacterium]
MVDSLLLDTGPLVALLDASEHRHADCVAYFRNWRGVALTTEAVVTEATHLLRRVDRAVCLDFIRRGGATVVPWSRSRLDRVIELIKTYASVPMDYADATLVVLAEEAGLKRVFTLDRRGFETYRWGQRRKFHIVP